MHSTCRVGVNCDKYGFSKHAQYLLCETQIVIYMASVSMHSTCLMGVNCDTYGFSKHVQYLLCETQTVIHMA